jgi:tRNA-modifying protein YgfZ
VTMIQNGRDLTGYEAVRGRGVYYPRLDTGYVRVGGSHRLDFIQRQTTNDVRRLTPEQALVTVLTSPAARIVDVFTLLHEEDAVGLVTQPGRAASAAAHLRSHIFFMDEVTVEDASAEFAQLDVEGDAAANALIRAGFGSVPSLGGVFSGEIAGVPARVVGQQGLVGTGYRVICPGSGLDTVVAALEDAGVSRLSDESYAILRVEAGLPATGHELIEDYTPLEVGLQSAVSDEKGCYTGQEVIARQITYDKVAQRLVGLRLDVAVPARADVLAGDRRVGRVTSSAESPRHGPIALAVVRRPHHEPGTRLSVADPAGIVEATVVPLPFSGG